MNQTVKNVIHSLVRGVFNTHCLTKIVSNEFNILTYNISGYTSTLYCVTVQVY